MSGAPVLQRAANKIKKVKYEQIRKSYARALKESLKIDSDGKPHHLSGPNEIATDYGVSTEVLLKFLICLDRKAAVAFLQDVGLEMSIASFSKRYTAQTYKKLFKREQPKVSNKHIFTYAEVLYLVGNGQALPFPDELNDDL